MFIVYNLDKKEPVIVYYNKLKYCILYNTGLHVLIIKQFINTNKVCVNKRVPSYQLTNKELNFISLMCTFLFNDLWKMYS